jgi:hypothetical protein
MARLLWLRPLWPIQLSPSQVAALCLLLTLLFTVASTQLLVPGAVNPLDQLRTSFSPRGRADYTTTVDRQIHPLRVPASARPD